jgi:hypothetical protein
MTVSLINKPDSIEKRRLAFFLEDDFEGFNTGDTWTSLIADSGTSCAATDAANGVLSLGTAATDNNEAMFRTTKEVFLIAANRTIEGQARISFTEANTDDANVCFGFADAIGANTLVDNGAGIKTSFSGAMFYKVDGGTKWKVTSSIGSTQTTNTTDVTAGGGYQLLTVRIVAISSTQADVTYFIDDQQCRDNTTGELICHRITYTGATEMQVGGGVKAGDANAETLLVDFVTAAQTR